MSAKYVTGRGTGTWPSTRKTRLREQRQEGAHPSPTVLPERPKLMAEQSFADDRNLFSHTSAGYAGAQPKWKFPSSHPGAPPHPALPHECTVFRKFQKTLSPAAIRWPTAAQRVTVQTHVYPSPFLFPAHDLEQVAKFLQTSVFPSGLPQGHGETWTWKCEKRLKAVQGAVTVVPAQIPSQPPHYSEPGQGGFWKLVEKGAHGSVSMRRGFTHAVLLNRREADSTVAIL